MKWPCVTWRRRCEPRAVLVVELIDEISLTDSQWEVYLRTLPDSVAATLQAAAAAIEER